MSCKASIAIITYNRIEELILTLQYLSNYQNCYDEIIVVDNGSNDNAIALASEIYSDIKTIRLHKNTGVSEARNIAAANAKNQIIIFIDDDGFLKFDVIPKLIEEFQKREDYAVIGCNIINVEKDKAIKEIAVHIIGGEKEKITINKARSFWGTAFLIKKEPFAEVGMFPDHFFYSNEENDLSMRLVKAGYNIGFCKEAIMLHYKAESGRPALGKTYFYYRNKQFEIWRNIPLIYAIIESLGVIIAGYFRAKEGKQIKEYILGTAIGLMRVPKIFWMERMPMTYKQYREYVKIEDNYKYWRRIMRFVASLLKMPLTDKMDLR